MCSDHTLHFSAWNDRLTVDQASLELPSWYQLDPGSYPLARCGGDPVIR